jgi:DNA-binding NtrC family response regulator
MVFGTYNQELVLMVLSDWPRAHLIVKKALQESNGNIQETARKLNVGIRTIYRWIDAHPELRSEIEEMRKETDE